MTKKGLYEPPGLAIKLFRWYCRPDRLEELEGDLEEFFYLRKEYGEPLWRARLFFWWNVVRCYKTYSKTKTQNSMTSFPLFKSYFKLALRHSWKNKWSVMINVAGLGIALSMCIFVYSIYAYNFEFDSFYDVDNIYRVNSMTFENGQERRNEISPYAMDEVLRNELSGVTQVSSFIDNYLTVKKEKEYFKESVGVVSTDFFKMFEIPLWYGSLDGFGEKPLVYLTKPTAKKYFGDEVALGEQLTIYLSSNRKIDVTVAGVFERIPLNSSFDINMIMNLNDFTRVRELKSNDWESKFYVSHYIKTQDASIPDLIEGMSRYLPQQNDGHKELKITGFEIIPFHSSIHNDSYINRSNANTRLATPIYIIFTTLALMIFFIACFNLANSSIALISKRLKEIGIRKTLGSENRQIMSQFLIEMGVICALAFVIGLSMINFTSRSIMGLFGETFLIRDINLIGVILFIVGFLIITTLVAGLMPAFYAWKFQPVEIMRKSAKLKGIGWVNKTLTIAQYGFSIAMLSAAFSFANNQQFFEDLELGYANESIYALEVQDDEIYPIIKQRIDQISGVKTVGTFNHLQRFGRSSKQSLLTMDTSTYEVNTYKVGKEYLETMEVPITLGRSFMPDSESDQQNGLIVNQEFVNRYFQGKDPINQIVKIDEERKTIVGVFPNIIFDVYIDSEEEPTVFMYEEADSYPFIIAKVEHGNKSEIESQFKSIWSEEVDKPYNGNWQKDLAYGSAVSDSTNLRIIFMTMAILGGFLSVAGIFSLSKLNVAKRIKEISIRKVLGSSFKQLLMTVNKSFFVVLSVSMIIGCVLGYFISDMVLGMVYRLYVDVSPLTSLFSGLFIVGVAILIIILSILSPVRANPVVGLREE